MKKIIWFFMTMLLGLVALTSCIDGNNESTGGVVGVLDYSSKGFTYVLKTDYGNYYASEINSLITNNSVQLGDCLYFGYKIDFDLAENSEAMVESRGYYTVSLNTCQKFDKYYINSILTDTTTIQTSEIAVKDPLYEYINTFYSRYMYTTHIVNQPENLELRWDLSYDEETKVTIENDKRYYELYLRAVKTNTSDKSNVDYPHLNSYDMGGYMREVAQMEKEALGSSYNASSSRLTLRINYVSEIKGDTAIVWSSKDLFPTIAYFLPSESN